MSILLYMLEAGAGLALFYGIFEIFLRKETYFGLNRFYLIGAAGLSFVVPALRLTSPFFTAAAPATAAPSLSPLPSLEGLPVPAAGLAGAATPGAGFVLPVSIGDLLLIVYAAGVLVCLAKRAGLLIRLASFVRRGSVVRACGLKVVRVADDLSPFSFFGFVFLNERSIDDGERRRILAHESVHVRQLHSLDLLLMELVATLQWFNPLVWPYRKRLQETHEYLADAGVIAQGFGQAEYQLLLLEQHVGAGVFEFANNLRQSQIKRRILMLSKQKSRGPARLKPLLVLPLTALLALAFAEPKPAVSVSGVPDQEKAAAAETAVAAKRQLEGLKAAESSLLKDYSGSENLAQKRDILAKLREILRAEEECAWVLTGKPGALETPELAVPADETVPEGLPLKSALLPKRSPEEYRLQQKVENLRRLERELTVAIEKTSDVEKKRQYEAQLADVRLAEEEAGGSLGTPSELAGLDSRAALDLQIKNLKHVEQELRLAAEQAQDQGKRAEIKATLSEVLRREEEIKAGARDLKLRDEALAVADLETQFVNLKNQEAKLRTLLQTDLAAADRAKAEEALAKNLDNQKMLKIRLEKLNRKEAEPVR